MAEGESEKSLHDTIMELSNLNLSNSDTENHSPPSTPITDLHPTEVIPYLFLGNARSSANRDVLKKLGIKCILNVTLQVPNVFEQDEDFKYMQIPIKDHWSQNLSNFFPSAIKFIGKLACS
jgi:dual specificity MAP kinase phosphatase